MRHLGLNRWNPVCEAGTVRQLNPAELVLVAPDGNALMPDFAR